MPTITITFEHQQAEVPKYTFGDRLVVKDDCAPQDWLAGEVVGMTLETEIYSPRWWYSLKLNSPLGYTEEYSQDELVPATQIAVLQAEWEQTEANWVQEDDQKLLPKFQPGTRVRLNAESGFQSEQNPKFVADAIVLNWYEDDLDDEDSFDRDSFWFEGGAIAVEVASVKELPAQHYDVLNLYLSNLTPADTDIARAIAYKNAKSASSQTLVDFFFDS